MYYHEIAFLPQFRFLLTSFLFGIADGIICTVLCCPFFSKIVKSLFDFLFVIITCTIIVITNIIYQDAALRVYEVIAFFVGIIVVVITIKRKSDLILLNLYKKVLIRIFTPAKRIYELIINNLKILLKKISLMLYNLYIKVSLIVKRIFKVNGNKEKEKKE